MGYRAETPFDEGSNQRNPRIDLAEAGTPVPAADSLSRPRHLGAPLRRAGHARPLGGCRSFDLSEAFDRLDGNE